MDNETFDRLKAAKEKYHPIAMNIPGVHGTSIGFKEVGGKVTDTLSIRVHLTQKRPLNELQESERLPEMVEGFPVDVIEHSQPQPHTVNNENKYRPLLCGCQLKAERGAFSYMIGTLGCFVWDVNDMYGKWYCLSNAHVLNADNWVYQASYINADCIGKTKRAILNDRIDAAICSIDYFNDAGDYKFVDGLEVQSPYYLTIKDMAIGLRKYGRTTGLTTGVLAGVNYSGERSDGWNFKDQAYTISDSPMSLPGDSGSVVTKMDGSVVGLLWGGDEGGKYGFFSPIEFVISDLNVAIIFRGAFQGAESDRHPEEKVES